MKEKRINVSNTTLSYNRRGTIKFDAKQAERHDFGKAHCDICDEVFIKLAHNAKLCSEECKREKKNARNKAYYEKNREKMCAQSKAYREKNRKNPEWVAKNNARAKAYRAKNREEMLTQQKTKENGGYFTTTIENKEWGKMMAKELMKTQFTEEE